MIALKRILVPMDFSETAECALKYAKALADAFQATIHILHVMEDPIVHGWTVQGPIAFGYRDEIQKKATSDLAAVLTPADKERFRAELIAKFGNPFIEIVRYAKSENIDIIVMGTHGRGPIAHMLMGSVAEKVVRKAPCPVLTVRHPEHEFVVP